MQHSTWQDNFIKLFCGSVHLRIPALLTICGLHVTAPLSIRYLTIIIAVLVCAIYDE